jgi:hypothetical protein
MVFRRLPVNNQWDSLAIGTMQGLLLEKGYYHDEPCGVFGPGTLKGLKTWLRDEGFYPQYAHMTNR